MSFGDDTLAPDVCTYSNHKHEHPVVFTVAQLIEALKEMPQDGYVYANGCDGCTNGVISIYKDGILSVVLDVNVV